MSLQDAQRFEPSFLLHPLAKCKLYFAPYTCLSITHIKQLTELYLARMIGEEIIVELNEKNKKIS
jgi:hypothetical protein